MTMKVFLLICLYVLLASSAAVEVLGLSSHTNLQHQHNKPYQSQNHNKKQKLNIKAYVDGISELHLTSIMKNGAKGNKWKAQWHHFQYAAPGVVGLLRQEATYVQNEPWYPRWPLPNNENRDCHCESSVYEFDMPTSSFWPHNADVISLERHQCRGTCSVKRLPHNDTIVIHLDDSPFDGPTWYDLNLVWMEADDEEEEKVANPTHEYEYEHEYEQEQVQEVSSNYNSLERLSHRVNDMNRSIYSQLLQQRVATRALTRRLAGLEQAQTIMQIEWDQMQTQVTQLSHRQLELEDQVSFLQAKMKGMLGNSENSDGTTTAVTINIGATNDNGQVLCQDKNNNDDDDEITDYAVTMAGESAKTLLLSNNKLPLLGDIVQAVTLRRDAYATKDDGNKNADITIRIVSCQTKATSLASSTTNHHPWNQLTSVFRDHENSSKLVMVLLGIVCLAAAFWCRASRTNKQRNTTHHTKHPKDYHPDRANKEATPLLWLPHPESNKHDDESMVTATIYNSVQ